MDPKFSTCRSFLEYMYVGVVFSLGVPLPHKYGPHSMFPRPQETQTLTWELIAIARSKSGVATAIGRHKVGVALNTERKSTVLLVRPPRVWGWGNNPSHFPALNHLSPDRVFPRPESPRP